MEVRGHFQTRPLLPSPLPSHGERTLVPIGLGGYQKRSGRFVVPAGGSDKRHAIYERGGSSFNHDAIGGKDGCRHGRVNGSVHVRSSRR